MKQLITSKNRKKQSRFQKLWEQAEQHKKKNARFRNELEALVQQVRLSVYPAEREAASADKPLLLKLLSLGQRKSLAQWQRAELDEWIHELLHEMQIYGLVDAVLLDDMARYDAFRMGITLKDEEIAPPVEQLMEIFQREQAAQEAAVKEMRDTHTVRKQAAQEEAEQQVEYLLDKQLGPEPGQSKNRPTDVEDLWQDELDEEIEHQRVQYQKARAQLRKELLNDLLKDIDHEFDNEHLDFDEEEAFDFNFDSESEDLDPILPSAPTITNQIFQRLFRSTAARLHPDREPDPGLREVKQGLMSDLLKARKTGDVMTILELYQEYVDSEQIFTKADEKQLITALEHQIFDLQGEQTQIIEQSPAHQMAYERFYYSSKKKTDKAIAEHLIQVSQDKIDIERTVKEIRSLKTLKPWLEQRYEVRSILPGFAELAEMFEEETEFWSP